MRCMLYKLPLVLANQILLFSIYRCHEINIQLLETKTVQNLLVAA